MVKTQTSLQYIVKSRLNLKFIFRSYKNFINVIRSFYVRTVNKDKFIYEITTGKQPIERRHGRKGEITKEIGPSEFFKHTMSCPL